VDPVGIEPTTRRL